MSKKKVLLTNFNILNYSGSEIDTVTIANYFISIGYDVYIFTLMYGPPLSNILNKKVKVIVPNEISKLEKEYDLIWSHHYPFLDYLIFNQKVKAKHIVYISLSSFEPLETLPLYYKHLSVVGALSDEAKASLNEQILDKIDIVSFPNYAQNSFFKHKIKPIKNIKKICIVSNHVPGELYDFKKIAENNSIEVDIYGMANIVKYIDDTVLSKYDCIISIGKTVYYSLAMGKIVYCYDMFGGYSFITTKNVDKSYKKNFSGRGGKQLTGEEIYKDIMKNYKKVNKDLIGLRKYAKEKFHFENNISKILNMLDESNKVDCDEIINNYPDLKIKSKLYIDTVNHKNNTIKYYEDKLTSANAEKDSLEASLNKQIEQLNNQINLIYNSTSYKISYPIRLLKKILQKLYIGVKRILSIGRFLN